MSGGDFITYYSLIGLAVNIATMFNDEIRESWFEFGFLAFIVQLAVSTVAFPLVILIIIESIEEE